MSAAAAKYARLARKAKRLSKFRRTCEARYEKEMNKALDCDGQEEWDWHRLRARRICQDDNTLYQMIRDIQAEMARLAGR